jgi:hypothetical protein
MNPTDADMWPPTRTAQFKRRIAAIRSLSVWKTSQSEKKQMPSEHS